MVKCLKRNREGVKHVLMVMSPEDCVQLMELYSVHLKLTEHCMVTLLELKMIIVKQNS